MRGSAGMTALIGRRGDHEPTTCLVCGRLARRADGRIVQIDEKLNAAPVALQLVGEVA